VKYRFVDEHRDVWPVRVMCRVLGVSASGYYAWRARGESPRARANHALLGTVRAIHAESDGAYGAPRVHAVLHSHGRRVGRRGRRANRPVDGSPDERIARLMRRAGLRGLAAIPRRVRTTDSRHDHPIAPNRLRRNFTATAPNQVWLADLTYVRTGEVWLFLAALIDMFTRKVVGWAVC
jgi:putative transposase